MGLMRLNKSHFFMVFCRIRVGEDSIGSGIGRPGCKEHAQGGGFWCLLQGLVLEEFELYSQKF
jgi:hypothetical protein